MADKRSPLPLMLTAQDLREGGVVYWDGNDWQGDIAAGLVARDEAAAAALEVTRQAAERGNDVIDVFLFTLGGDGAPAHFRERGRVNGPSIAYGTAR